MQHQPPSQAPGPADGPRLEASTGPCRSSRRWKRALAFALLAVLLPFGGRSLAYQLTGFRYYIIPTSSMAPTLLRGDRIRVEEGSGRGVPHRGELWVFYLPDTAGSIAVKRVVGLPGETIAVASGRVYVDGRPLSETYVSAAPTYTMSSVVLGPDEYFMLGDNRNMSHDSHVWGPLKRGLLLGRARQRLWPPRRLGGL